jgi:L-ribulokinase
MMQIYADVLGCPIRVCAGDQTCALGAAILASAAAGCHGTLRDAMAAMAAPTDRTYLPNAKHIPLYDQLYRIYEQSAHHFALHSDVLHRLMALRRGGDI